MNIFVLNSEWQHSHSELLFLEYIPALLFLEYT